MLALLLGSLGAMLDRRGRRVALSNLRVAFGDEISSKRRAQIVRESYQHFARTMLDCFWSRRLTSQNFSRYVEFENREDYVAGSSRTTMSGRPQRKLRLFFAHSPPPRKASQIDNPPKDRWRNVMFPLDI